MTTPRLQALKKFLEAEPNDAFTMYAIALEHASAKNLPEAISQLEEVIAVDPNYVPAYQQLGNFLRQSGQADEAITMLEHGIRVAAVMGDRHAQGEMQEVLDELEDEGH